MELGRLSLDGERWLTAADWAAELGIKCKAVFARRGALEQRLAGGMDRAAAHALAMRPRVKLHKRWKKRRPSREDKTAA